MSDLFPVRDARTRLRSARLMAREGTKTYHRLDIAALYLNKAFDAEARGDMAEAVRLASLARHTAHLAGMATTRRDLVQACHETHQALCKYEQALWSIRTV